MANFTYSTANVVSEKGGKNSNGSSKGNSPTCITEYVDQGSMESARYFYARQTLCEMLRDRGYEVPAIDLSRSLDDFRRLFGQYPNVETLTLCVTLRSNPSTKVLVTFMATDDIKVDTIRNLYGKIMNQQSLSGLIVVIQSKMTAFAVKELQKWPFKVEIFKINDLLVNASKHICQPKYEVLTTDEKKNVLEKYNVEEKQLPRMLEADPIARYYGLEKGQVVKITHTVGRRDTVENYRCVV